MTSQLFTTVPERSYLDLYDGTTPKFSQIKKFLDLSKADVAKATDVAPASIREDRLPKAVEERLFEIAIVCELVAGFFGGDVTKTAQWFRLPNPSFGNISPRDMIRFGRFRRLLSFVQTALAANAEALRAREQHDQAEA